MQLESFRYSVSPVVTLTGPELACILALGLDHYDSECKRECLFGGYVHGLALRALPTALDSPQAATRVLVARLQEATEASSFTIERCKLDRMVKILELHELSDTPDTALALYWGLKRIMARTKLRERALNEGEG